MMQFDFAAAPAMLSRDLLARATEAILPSDGSLSILELYEHTSTFTDMVIELERVVRRLLHVPQNYRILFMQGGQSMQYSAIPMNLLSDHKCADYIITGRNSKMAAQEAKKYGDIAIVETSAGALPIFSTVPETSRESFRPDADYVHICFNETAFGTKFPYIPDTGNIPLVANMSSCLFTIPIDVSKFGLIYAASQYNISTSGMTLVIIREDLIGKALPATPALLDYQELYKAFPSLSVPPAFTLLLAKYNLEHIEKIGGVDEMFRRAERKASLIYDYLDNSEYYTSPTNRKCRSITNIVFFTGDQDKDAQFIREAHEEGLCNLDGPRSIGGMRASLYNAMPYEGVERLVAFMKRFAADNPKISVDR